MRHVLKRAIGLDAHLSADYGEGNLQIGDVFALLSDGVWDSLGEQAIHAGLSKFDAPKLVAEYLTDAAIKKSSQDNSTAVIVKIMDIGRESLLDLIAGGKQLNVPPKLKINDVIDGFAVVEILHESRASLLYKVKNIDTNQLFVLKTLQPLLANDSDSCNGLLNEEWLGKRVVSQDVPQILPLSTEKRSKLYYVMSWHEGATLQQRLDSGHHFTVAGTAKIGIEMMRGLGALHRLSIIHRDIKPANVHIASDQRLRILDLGVAYSKNAGKMETSQNAAMNNINFQHVEFQHIAFQNVAFQNPGTPSFMAPELFDGAQANEQSDIYAAGVTLYHLLNRKYPHGEIEPFQHPKFGEPTALTRYRPDIPAWLDNIIQKAIARDLKKLFETAEEMLLALEHGELKPLHAQRTPLIARARLVKWQWIAIFSIIINMLLLYILLVS